MDIPIGIPMVCSQNDTSPVGTGRTKEQIIEKATRQAGRQRMVRNMVVQGEGPVSCVAYQGIHEVDSLEPDQCQGVLVRYPGFHHDDVPNVGMRAMHVATGGPTKTTPISALKEEYRHESTRRFRTTSC